MTAIAWSTRWRSASRSKDQIFYAAASGVGMPIVYLGSKTGRDGIHGATMASAEFGDDAEEKRPTVQVGDPFSEKLLLEACLEIMAKGCVIAIQDMGAAGLTCSAVEMGAKGDLGVTLDLDKVPCREEGMSAYEMMLSESQERMLMVLKPEKEKEAEAIFRKWGLDFAVVGETTPTKRFIVRHGGEVMADLPIKELGDVRRRNTSGPSSATASSPVDRRARRARRRIGIADALETLLGSPDLCSKRWVWEQYDHVILGNTVQRPGGDAAVVRVDDGPKALALTTDVTPRYCEADPFEGGKQAVAECWRNLTAVGAQAARDHRQSQFRQSRAAGDHGPVRRLHPRHRGGLQGARLSRSSPATSRSTTRPTAARSCRRRRSAASALIDDFTKSATLAFKRAGEAILLVGETTGWLGQSHVSARNLPAARRARRRRSISTEERENGDFVRGADPRRHGDRGARPLRRRAAGRARRDGDGLRHRRGARRPRRAISRRMRIGSARTRRAISSPCRPAGRGRARARARRRACRCSRIGVTGGDALMLPGERPIAVAQ